MMDEQEFDAAIKRVETEYIDEETAVSLFDIQKLTDAQLTVLCEHVKHIPSGFVITLVTHERISKSHIDIILERGFASDRELVYVRYANITPEQLDVGLNDKFVEVQHKAYNHPKCTEAQKVAYLLKWGR